ncbi:MAG: alcohol dehydrogenase catalytic domain-containing protein [Armatimonadetes bacterium]|nr:alcohol dehydrogenase catalytic domain-containing protein [Armatimonadota bacterium]
MHAFIIQAAHTAAVDTLPVPDPPPGQALVRVQVCGLCGSDLHAYEGSQPFFRYPEIPGHEVVGEIVRVNPSPEGLMRLTGRPVATGLAPGERVVLDPGMPCGDCHPCRHGRYNCCENMRVIGVHAPGALAEFFCAPLECLHRVPRGLSDEVAVLAEPLSIGVQANNRARTSPNDTMLIIGSGSIGLCVMAVARHRGARVAVSDLSEARRNRALSMGADAAFDPTSPTFRADLEAFCGDSGPDIVVEAVGKANTVAQALDLVVAGGRVVLLGLISDPITFPGNVMVKKELDFLGSRLHRGTIPDALELLAAGYVDIASLLTHRLALSETEEGLRMMASSPDQVIKAAVFVG